MKHLEDFQWYVQGEKRLAKNTVESYASDLRAWMEAGLDLESDAVPSSAQLRGVLLKFETEGLKPATLARRSACLRLFIRFRSLRSPEWEKILEAIPVSRMGENFPKALNLTDIQKILDFDPGSDPEARRDRAMLELLYAAGLRVSELADLKITQIERRAGWLRIQGKGGKERIVPFTERAGHWLEKYLEEVRPVWADQTPRRYAEHVFLSRRLKPLSRMGIWKILHKRSLVCGVDGVHPHIFRHSFATHLLQGGADIRFVQALLGHSSLGTTERYIKVADDELRKLFDDIHPLRALQGP